MIMWQAIHCHELLAYPCSQEVLIELTVVVISFSNLCFHYGAMLFVRATLKQLTRICFKTQLVFASLTCNTKRVVFSLSCCSSRVFKIHMKPATLFCQAMNLVESEPKLTIQSLVCSLPSRDRNQPSRPVSSGTLSTPHRLSFGHNTRRRHLCCRG